MLLDAHFEGSQCALLNLYKIDWASYFSAFLLFNMLLFCSFTCLFFHLGYDPQHLNQYGRIGFFQRKCNLVPQTSWKSSVWCIGARNSCSGGWGRNFVPIRQKKTKKTMLQSIWLLPIINSCPESLWCDFGKTKCISAK